jgi:hypothetical protein
MQGQSCKYKSPLRYGHLQIYISLLPFQFFPPFWLDIDQPKEIDITEPDG